MLGSIQKTRMECNTLKTSNILTTLSGGRKYAN